MFSLDLSNGSKLVAGVDLIRRDLTITQIIVPASPGGPTVAPQVIRIPLADLKKTAETVSQLVKAFRG